MQLLSVYCIRIMRLQTKILVRGIFFRTASGNKFLCTDHKKDTPLGIQRWKAIICIICVAGMYVKMHVI